VQVISKHRSADEHVEQHGQHHGGDDGEQDHDKAPRPAPEGADLEPAVVRHPEGQVRGSLSCS